MKRDKEKLTTVGSLQKWEGGKGSEIPKIPVASLRFLRAKRVE